MKPFLVIIVLLISVTAVQAADVSGPARVVDGHTLDVGGQVVRLYGIQAPHPDQTCQTRKGKTQQCGQLAIQALATMVRGQPVRCEDKGADALGRMQGLCFVSWMNLSEEMVVSGHALADPDTGTDFKRAETFAKARKEGLWRTTFTNPWEWRGQ